MKVLGITGGIGAGKSTVSRLFQDLGADVVDADKIAHEILEPQGAAFSDVIAAFGKGIQNEKGEIDRKSLAALVFHDAAALERLNSLTHPHVFAVMQQKIRDAKADLICLDVPLLFSAPFPIPYDASLAVVAPREVRIARVMQRSGLTREQVTDRIDQQITDADMRKMADYVIENDGDLAALFPKVEKIYRRLTV